MLEGPKTVFLLYFYEFLFNLPCFRSWQLKIFTNPVKLDFNKIINSSLISYKTSA